MSSILDAPDGIGVRRTISGRREARQDSHRALVCRPLLVVIRLMHVLRAARSDERLDRFDHGPLEELEEHLVAHRLRRIREQPLPRQRRERIRALDEAQISGADQRVQQLRHRLRSGAAPNRQILRTERPLGERVEHAELRRDHDRPRTQEAHVRVDQRHRREAERQRQTLERILTGHR